MAYPTPQFPGWDGTTESRTDRTTDKAADAASTEQITAEILAMQEEYVPYNSVLDAFVAPMGNSRFPASNSTGTELIWTSFAGAFSPSATAPTFNMIPGIMFLTLPPGGVFTGQNVAQDTDPGAPLKFIGYELALAGNEEWVFGSSTGQGKGPSIGLALSSYDEDNKGVAVYNGSTVYNSDWTDVTGSASLTPTVIYYLGPNGTLTPNKPIWGYLQEMGIALNANYMYPLVGPWRQVPNTMFMEADEDISEGEPISVNSSGDGFELASTTGNPVIGLAAKDTDSGDTAWICTSGELELSDWTESVGSSTLTIGAQYWLSTTDGLLTSTEPTSGSYQYVGTAITTTKMLLNIGVKTSV